MNRLRYSPYFGALVLIIILISAGAVWAAPGVIGDEIAAEQGAAVQPVPIEEQALAAAFLADSSQPAPLAPEPAPAQASAEAAPAPADAPAPAVHLPPGAMNYFWNFYDSLAMNSWILMANEDSAPENLTFNLSIADFPMTLGDYGNGPGVVAPGEVIPYINPGMIGGPVIASSLTGQPGVVSQRSLLGDSFEEVLGTDMAKASRHFYWTWYDMQSDGFSNWIVVNNPDELNDAAYVIRIGGVEIDAGTIPAGGMIFPTYPGTMGGPVEVITDRDVMATQRVLSNNGAAFNEMPGIPAEDLSDHYFWTWYDMQSPGYANWILLANPHLSNPVDYEIKIGGATVETGSIPANGRVTPTFPGTMNGPVEVIATGTGAGSGNIIATQRIISGPSFGEVPGYDGNALSDDYDWTWYDMTGAFQNWVLIVNPDAVNDVTYTVKIGGAQVASGLLGPGQKVTPTFPGTMMDGPVEVRSLGGPVVASQRVTRNGYFNEVLGMTFGNDNPPQPPVDAVCARVR